MGHKAIVLMRKSVSEKYCNIPEAVIKVVEFRLVEINSLTLVCIADFRANMRGVSRAQVKKSEESPSGKTNSLKLHYESSSSTSGPCTMFDIRLTGVSDRSRRFFIGERRWLQVHMSYSVSLFEVQRLDCCHEQTGWRNFCRGAGNVSVLRLSGRYSIR